MLSFVKYENLEERWPTRSWKDNRYIVYFLSVQKCPFTKKICDLIMLSFHVLFAKVVTAKNGSPINAHDTLYITLAPTLYCELSYF